MGLQIKVYIIKQILGMRSKKKKLSNKQKHLKKNILENLYSPNFTNFTILPNFF